MLPPIVAELIATTYKAIDELKERIHNVKDAGIKLDENDPEGGYNLVYFEIDDKAYIGKLIGRNREVVLGFNSEADKAIATRVLLDGDYEEKIT